ncbi:hypothetical protein PGT21_008987 [Puccinia graminis f. sp. tritici]|uniref:Ran GTPase-activating protein 1 n=2 Tax=Puccinia graminis f. sp. tritici TaxID=56615 RepID=E3JXN8_PUCGT|nr:uncharacterized protein PGTG_02274 [Puccinia graminis f. sp. tritici CRL 75-36-700-3]EFP76813.1 hypothetical protein PGTG_02274 [Puccinia graminis f. sp. tritici CRL 75-36-700-3]KAA1118871.1 hypothetical protein PGT21_008987 [Puccinia graminis f. sp. tritici]KAA1135476.1 hypothetical protein PGTUg99_028512 [Puccinia graminis f. sp. tritici]
MSTSSSVFSLKGQSLKCDSGDAIGPHLEPLIADQDVQVVVFGGNTFGVGACEQIGIVLKDKLKLKEADLADIFTGRLISEIPQSLGSLCNSLLNLQNLTIVDLSDNAFGGRCVDVMVPFLSSHLPLEELRLANNGLGPAGATVIANALHQLGMKAQEAGQTSRLRKIVCGRNRCENGSTQAWGKAFQVHPELIEVRLFQNDIRNNGWDPIMAGLSHCSKLQVLDMWDNTATEKGSKAVANALPHLSALRELNLGDCLLKPRGGAMIARALKLGNNPGLEHLKLSGSEIDEEVVGLLVDYVKEFGSKLKKVELNDNYGDADAAGELSGIWGAMKEALDAWENGAELDELDEIIERESDDEDENSQASDDDDDGDSEVEEKSVAEQDSANDQLAATKEDEEEASAKPTHSHPESSSSQSKVTQPTPPAVPATSVDHDMQPPEIVEKGPESHTGETEGTATAASSKKEKPSKEDGLYDLLTQTIEALKIT